MWGLTAPGLTRPALWHGVLVTSMARRARFEAIAPGLIDPLRRFLARRSDAATADDALGDTLVVLWRRLDEVPQGEELPWAYGVARHCLANAERSHRRQQRVASKIAVVDPPLEASEASEASYGTERDADEVREALGALPERDAELLRLWAWERLGASEIAVVLDITANAAGIRLHRARGKLREELRKIRASAGHEGSTEGRTP